MNTFPEPEEFQDVRRWLAVKRFEQPPPGYFDGFPRQVMLRIQEIEAQRSASWLDRLQGQIPGIQRLWDLLDAKPMLAGAFGMTVCGLLAGGLFYSYRVDPASADQMAAVPADGSVFFAERPATTMVFADHQVGIRPADLPVQLISAREGGSDMLGDPSVSLFAPRPHDTPRAPFTPTPR
jgi:hypothetical protein